MTRATLAALLSHWRRNPLQLFTLLAGLALATALWSGVQAVNAEARASYDAAAETLGEGRFDQVVAAEGGPIPLEAYAALRRAGWPVSPVIEGRIEGVRLLGIDPLTAPGGLGPAEAATAAGPDAFLAGRGRILADADTLARLAPVLGGADAPEPMVSPEIAPGTAVTDIGVAARLLRQEGASRLLVGPPPAGQPLPPLGEVAPGLSLRPAESGSDVARLTDSFHLNLTAFGALSFLVGLFIVHGAIALAFEQRRPAVRTMRALGVPLGRLVALMAAELAVFALVAGAIGVGLGYLIAATLLPDVAATLRGLYGASLPGTLELRTVWWASGLAIALGGTAVAAAGAFWRLARMPLLASGQPRAWAMAAGRGARLQGVAAVGLLALAGGLAAWGGGLAAGFAMLAALLVGAALALPLALGAVLGLGARLSRGVVSGWFWADTRQQLPGLSLALMALLLAMAANIGVSTMVSSFRLTFVGFLDQRLAAELYVSAADPAEAEALVAFVGPRVQAVLPILSAEAELAGAPGEVLGARDHATYRENWDFLLAVPGVWDRVAAGEAVLVNEQLYRRAGLGLGDRLQVAPGTALPVAGVYGDYGNPSGQAILGEEAFRALYPQVAATRFGLRLPPGDVASVAAALREDFGLPDDSLIDQAGIKAFSLEVFDRTFRVTGALNVLTLAVAGFAILMSLLTLAGMRVPQLAPVWALGLTRRALGRLELARAVMLALLTALAALPLGLALAWVLLAVVNVAAFGWRLPMHHFPADYARLGLLALAAAALAALWPARRLARTPPADLLKVFTNER